MNLKSIFDEIAKYYEETPDKVVEFKSPQQLEKLIDINPNNKITSDEELLVILKNVIKYSVKSNHKMFFNQLYVGSDKYTALSELIVALLNTSMYTYEMSSVFTMMENILFDRIKKIFGFNNTADIIMSPGGSLSNITALHAAIYNYDKNINNIGIYKQKPFKIFISEDAHYSWIKGTSFLGLGSNSIVKIKCNNGCMIVGELKKAIQFEIENDNVPLMIVATSGTTVLGAFDPIKDISNICKYYNIWLHVDAALGGTVIFSNKYKYLLNGIFNADSCTWNPHKMLRIPLQCSLLFLKDHNIAYKSNSIEASYLFQTDKYYNKTGIDNLDSGKKYIQCGRRVDILKLWTAWKIRGEDGFEKDVDKAYFLAHKFKEKINKHKKFKLVINNTQGTNICFWYIPQNEQFNLSNSKKINMIAPKIKEYMLKTGKILISYQPLESMRLPNFFRIVFINPELEENDLDKIIITFDELGKYTK